MLKRKGIHDLSILSIFWAKNPFNIIQKPITILPYAEEERNTWSERPSIRRESNPESLQEQRCLGRSARAEKSRFKLV